MIPVPSSAALEGVAIFDPYGRACSPPPLRGWSGRDW